MPYIFLFRMCDTKIHLEYIVSAFDSVECVPHFQKKKNIWHNITNNRISAAILNSNLIFFFLFLLNFFGYKSQFDCLNRRKKLQSLLFFSRRKKRSSNSIIYKINIVNVDFIKMMNNNSYTHEHTHIHIRHWYNKFHAKTDTKRVQRNIESNSFINGWK